MTTARSEHYKQAGVDIDAADRMIDRIKPLVESTRIPGATGGLGGFGGLFDLAAAGFGPQAPRLVAGTDGVGTKLKVAFALNRHDTIGIDCVAMCVNDILTTGARPLFFLDYFATGRLHPDVGVAIVSGISEGCRQAGCWLLGGETAEMPGMYPDGEYDIAGFAVGAVTDSTEISQQHTAEGDVVIGIASSGLHSNGYSLARRVLLEQAGLAMTDTLPGDTMTVGERLLVPTRIYVKLLDALLAAGVRPHALAHITGGGLWENPHRSIRPDLAVQFDVSALRSMVPPLMSAISRLGSVSEREMYRVFNMGVGFTIAVAATDVDRALEALRAFGETPQIVGRLVPRGEAHVTIDGVSDAPIA
jgi:phosphoribosylformylglycinamidine cyclo-ligase